MLSVPVRRSGLATLIQEAEIADARALPKIMRTIEQCYARAPHLAAARTALTETLTSHDEHLLDLSPELIDLLRSWLQIETPLIRSSTLDVSGSKAVLVRSLCQTLAARPHGRAACR